MAGTRGAAMAEQKFLKREVSLLGAETNIREIENSIN